MTYVYASERLASSDAPVRGLTATRTNRAIAYTDLDTSRCGIYTWSRFVKPLRHLACRYRRPVSQEI